MKNFQVCACNAATGHRSSTVDREISRYDNYLRDLGSNLGVTESWEIISGSIVKSGIPKMPKSSGCAATNLVWVLLCLIVLPVSWTSSLRVV